MKKLLSTIGKTLLFFVGWALLGSLLPVPESPNQAVWRFWAELIPFLTIVAFTILFWLLEKRKIELHIISSPLKNILTGLFLGTIWIGIAAIVLMLLGTMKIVACNSVPMLWIFSVFLNAAMQELLVRGYLYQMLKSNYSVVVATIITTALFTLMHGGAFEAGILPVLNVLTMSLLMTLALEYMQSLMVPILMHFVWNCVGAIILGGVNLPDDYPHLCVTEFTGSTILSGGTPKMEGSIVVLILNIALILAFLLLLKRRKVVKSDPPNSNE